jgi:molybdenum cofactor cytidylyltransferase
VTSNVRAVVLAAGESKRMGAPKALLSDGSGHLFVTGVLRTLAEAGVSDLTVVTGTLHHRIVGVVAGDPPVGASVRFARNPDPARGQLSSLLTGLEAAAAPGVDALLVTLVDVPFVKPATVARVVEAFRRTGAPIVRPSRGERHGHPVLFARSLFDELRHADPEQGAKVVVRRHAAEIFNLETSDEAALLDVDTREQYARVIGPET